MKLVVRKTQKDTIDGFLMDCVIGTTDKSRATRNTVLYNQYLNWCRFTNTKPLPKISFGQHLGTRYFKRILDGYTYFMCELTDRILGRENDDHKGYL